MDLVPIRAHRRRWHPIILVSRVVVERRRQTTLILAARLGKILVDVDMFLVEVVTLPPLLAAEAIS